MAEGVELWQVKHAPGLVLSREVVVDRVRCEALRLGSDIVSEVPTYIRYQELRIGHIVHTVEAGSGVMDRKLS